MDAQAGSAHPEAGRTATADPHPASLKLAEGIGGILILNIGYCACLYACVRLGGNGSFAAIAVVYLIGATLGQAAPARWYRRGGGVLDRPLTAIAGVTPPWRSPSVLLFRLLTLWFPTIPGGSRSTG